LLCSSSYHTALRRFEITTDAVVVEVEGLSDGATAAGEGACCTQSHPWLFDAIEAAALAAALAESAPLESAERKVAHMAGPNEK
jgi:hypothetical protein